MAQNLCTPASLYGGFSQTLFLGCSISSFTASTGWSGQVTELMVILVEDTCPAATGKSKIYYDENLEQQTTTSADPGFVGEGDNAIVGAPAYFRFGDFEFSGLIQSWSKDNNNGTYNVKLVDPRLILEGTQLIIGEYSGGVGSTYNTINVYGFLESFGVPAPLVSRNSLGVYVIGDSGVDGAVFGTISNGFGGANDNPSGVQWSRILSGLNALINGNPKTTNGWCPFGRIVYKGPVGVDAVGYGLMAVDTGNFCEYFIDLSELPAMPTEWRLPGESISLMDAITLVCEEAGYEFYVELLPVAANISDSGIAKFIKIRTVNRNTQPSFGAIADFIAANQNGLISSSVGRELRNETMSSFVIGGNKQTVYQIDQNIDPEGDGDPTGNPELDDVITPFFGFKDNGDAIIPHKDADGFWEFEISVLGLEPQLQNLTFSDFNVTINERELLFALGGYDQWLSYSTTEPVTDMANKVFPDDLIGLFNLNTIVNLMKNPNMDAKLFPKDLLNTVQRVILGNRNDIANNTQLQDMQTIYNWVLGIAREYYGRKYMVRVPYTAAKLETVSNRIVTSEEPTDGGWTEYGSVIELSNPSVYLDFFRLDDSRIRPFVKFNQAEKKSLSALDPNDYIILYGGDDEEFTSDLDIVEDLIDSGSGDSEYSIKAWVKVDADPQYVYSNVATLASPRVLITLNAPVLDINDTAAANSLIHTRGIPKLVEKMILAAGEEANFKDNLDQLFKDIGAIETFFTVDFFPVTPDAAAVALRSNTLTYGPWYNPGPPGQTRVELDEDLVPWNYNGTNVMNLAGQARADDGLTNLQVTEMGNIEVAGYPTLPLGAELGAVAGGFYGGGTNLIENRNYSQGSFNDTHVESGAYSVNYAFFDYSGSWTGLYGPNITDISVSVGENGLTTNYGFRTYTPKYGRFAKYNADRLKQLSEQQRNINKLISGNILRLGGFNLQNIKSGLKRDINDFNQQGKAHANNSPHEILVGREKVWGDDGEFRRVNIASEEIADIGNEIADGQFGIGKKALMSLDGLLRPVQASELAAISNTSNSLPPFPPFYKYSDLLESGENAEQQYNLGISAAYLNPVCNPTGIGGGTKHIKAGDEDCGHDIDMLGKDELPAYSMSIPIEEYLTGTGYVDDYNYLCLRGPMVMRGWGYDTNGKPVPNRGDSGDSGTGLEDYFAENWLQKQNTWPVGPIDLRWDRERKVWVSPQSYKMVRVKLLGYLRGSNLIDENLGTWDSTSGLLLDVANLYDKDGLVIEPTGEEDNNRAAIIIYDKVGITAHSGDRLWAYWDDYSKKYYALSNITLYGTGDCNDSGSGVDWTDYNSYSHFSRLIFGDGLNVTDLGNGIGKIDSVGLSISHDDDPDVSGSPCWDYTDPQWTDISSITSVRSILFGPGMSVQQNSEEVTGTGEGSCGSSLRIDMNLAIGGYDESGSGQTYEHINKLVFSEPLQIMPTEVPDGFDGFDYPCALRIGIRDGFTGNLTYIRSASCSGSTWTVDTGELLYSNGILTGERDYAG
jgi:hypothetical protein